MKTEVEILKHGLRVIAHNDERWRTAIEGTLKEADQAKSQKPSIPTIDEAENFYRDKLIEELEKDEKPKKTFTIEEVEDLLNWASQLWQKDYYYENSLLFCQTEEWQAEKKQLLGENQSSDVMLGLGSSNQQLKKK